MFTVAIDTGPLYGPMTGVGRAVSGLLEELDRRNREIEVIRYVVSRRARLLPGTRRLPYPATFAIAAWAHFDRPRPDRILDPAAVVHGMNYVVPPVRCARVVSVYDTWALRHPKSSSPVVSRAMNVLKRNIGSGAVVHTTSQATADHIRDIFPHAEVHIVQLGFTPAPPPTSVGDAVQPRSSRSEELRSVLDLDAPYVLAVGTIERRKNLSSLVSAFSRTEAARTGTRLVLAGAAGDASDEVRRTIDRLDESRRRSIVHLGRVDDESLDALYRHAEAVAYPSLDEGFGFPLLEAMSRSVPVLASDSGSIPEIAGTAALLVDPLDIDSMASALDLILSDETLRRTLKSSGLERCSTFTWKRTADELIALYQDLVDRGDALNRA